MREIARGSVAQVTLGDSSCESNTVAELHEQTDTTDLQD